MKKRALGWSDTAGFSLTELMLVLCVAAIIIAMAVPGVNAMMENYNTVFAAQEICTYLHSAKLKAISSNESLRVHFLSTGLYQVELSDGTLLKGPYYLPKGIGLNTAGGSGITFPGSYVTFQPDGTLPVSGNGSAGRIKLLSPSGLRVDILVDRGGLIRQTPTYKTASAAF